MGYEPVSKTIEIRPDKEVTERISLSQKPVDVLPVVVEAHRAKIAHHQNPSVQANPEWTTVGVMRDAIRNLNLISGIQYGLPLTDLHLQGGQQSEHRILLDGVPVYNPYSFGQMFSSFSPYAIGNVRVHKTGYGVEAGSQIAGLINLSHDLHANGNNIVMQGDPLSANLRGDLSFTTGDDSSLQVMTALRTNFWDLYKNPTFKQTLQNWNIIDPLITNALGGLETDASIYSPVRHDSNIQFFDYHLASSYQMDEFNSISASLYVAENIVETRLLNQADNASSLSAAPYLYASEGYKWNNLMSQITWSQMITPRLDLSTQASYSFNQFEHQNQVGTSAYPRFFQTGSEVQYDSVTEFGNIRRRLPTQFDGNQIEHFILKTDGSYSISPHLLFQSGLQLDRVSSGIDISNLSYFPAQIDQSSTLLSSYFKTKHTFGNYWNIEWGSRFTYAFFSNRLYAEPRFSVQFDQPESSVGYWSAKLSGGLYRQFINEYQITNSGPTSVVPSFSIWSLSDENNIPKAWHLNGSTIIEPTENTSIKMELYYKWQPVTNITSYTNLSSIEAEAITSGANARLNEIRAFAESTEMKAWGGGVKLNQSFANSNLKFTAGYDYSYSKIDMESQFGRNMPAPWNEPHRTQLRVLWWVIPDLAISTKWQGIWGRAWAFRKSYYDFLRYRSNEIASRVSFNSPENDKLSPFQQIDLSFIYQPTIGTADLELRLELLNILNRKNTLEKYLHPVRQDGIKSYEIRNRNLPGFHPSVSLQVKF